MSGLFAHKLPASKPTLRQTLVRALQANDAAGAIYHDDLATEEAIDAAESERFDTREGFYAALGEHGIGKELADRIGELL